MLEFIPHAQLCCYQHALNFINSFDDRIIDRYEYCENSLALYPIEFILQDTSNANLKVTPQLLGKIVKEIWNGKVERVLCEEADTSQRTPSYNNLRKRAEVISDEITEFNQDALQQIQILCTKNHGWAIDQSSKSTHSISLISSGSNDITVDGYRLIQYIDVSISPPSITLRTFEEIVPLKVGAFVSLFAIESAIRFISITKPCLGQPIPTDEFGAMIRPVSNSKIVTVASPLSNEESRLISTSCSTITGTHLSSSSCSNCSYVYKLFRNRSYKRKSKGSSDIDPDKKCNARFLDRTALRGKIADEKKRRKNAKQNDARKKASNPEIFQSFADELEMPQDMKLLWEQQIKHLSTNSPKGYRWNPRFDYLIIKYILVIAIF